jgi:protein SCO1/2
MKGFVTMALCVIVAAGACRRAPEPKQYEVKGQIVSVDPERGEVLLDHEDIKNFMPAMTMSYKVEDPALLAGKEPGDLITATLVVGETTAHLSTLSKTGHAPLKSSGAGPAITDADLLKEGDAVPDNALVDETGKPSPLSAFRGHRVALTFIYTRCPVPDFCPLMDRQFADVQREVMKTTGLRDVRLLSVSFDPEFDTPAVLAMHAKALGADPQYWHFLTGERPEVMTFAKRLGVIAEPGDANSIVHNLRTAVVDSQGRLVKIYSGNMWTPAELVADLKAAPAPQP